jgi:hypothetical protein
MKVFVSYSRRDGDFVKRLGRELTIRGYDVWVDTEDVVGSGQDRWRRSIVAAIRACDAMVLVLSPNSTGSENVERELSVAAENRKRVIPIVFQECALPDGFQYELAGLQHIDFSQLPFDDGVRQLAQQLGRPGPLPPPHGVPSMTSPAVSFETAPRLRRRRKIVVFVAVGAVLTATTVAGWIVTRGGGGANARGGTSSSVVSTTASEERQAEALVAQWTDATTARRWDEAAKIDTSGTIPNYDQWYGAANSPNRMKSIQPYIDSAHFESGRWHLTGAVMAYDYWPYPNIRTNVVCSTWDVDLAQRTAKWAFNPKSGQKVPGQIPASAFATKYAEICKS